MNFPVEDAVERIRKNGWRQGMILPSVAMQALEQVCSDCVQDGKIAIVVSQSCDILHHSFENEPTIEVIIASPIVKQDNSLIHRRHPRKLHFPVRKNDGTTWFETHIRDRYYVGRDILAKYSPNQSLQLHQDDIKTISQWIASRYLRHAFPDNFVKRIDRKKIRKLLKQEKSAYLSGIYIRLSSYDELPDNEPYDIEIIGTITTENFEDKNKRQSAIELVNDIAGEMQCDGKIEANSECRSELEMTVHELRSFNRMSDFDDLSYGEDSPVELI